MYKLEDKFGPDDEEFWLQDLDLNLLYRNLYGTSKLPFKLKLSFQLKTGAIDMDLELRLFPLDSYISIQTMENEFDAIVNDLKDKSSNLDKSDGIIHNWHTQQMSDHWYIKLDMGSADFKFLKKILQRLSKMNHYRKVIVGRVENVIMQD